MKKWMPELCLLALAVYLRTAGIFSAALSQSEARLLLFANASNAEIWSLFLKGADRHFGATVWYVLIAKQLAEIGGPGAVRILSALCGVGALCALYAMARSIFGLAVARVAAGLAAVAPALILMSRECGHWSISVFLMMVAAAALYEIYKGSASTLAKIIFALCIVIGSSLNYIPLLLFVPANALFIVFSKRSKNDYIWWIPVQAILAFLAWNWWHKWTGGYFSLSTAPTFVGDMSQQGVIVQEGLFGLQQKLMFVEKYIIFLYNIGGFYGGGTLGNGWSVLGLLLIPVVFHYFPFLGFCEYEGGYPKRLFMFVCLSFLIGLVVFLSFTSERLDYALAPASMFLFVVCAHGAVKFASWRSRGALLLMALCMLFGFSATIRKNEKQRPDWKAAAAAIDAVHLNDAPIVFIDGWMTAPFIAEQPSRRSRAIGLFSNFDMEFLRGGRQRQDDILPFFNGEIDNYPPLAAKRLITENKYIWVVMSIKEGVEKPKIVLEYINWLKGNSVIEREKNIGGDVVIRLLSYRPAPPNLFDMRRKR